MVESHRMGYLVYCHSKKEQVVTWSTVSLTSHISASTLCSVPAWIMTCLRSSAISVSSCFWPCRLSPGLAIFIFYLYEVLGPGREDLSGQWSVWCSRLLNLP